MYAQKKNFRGGDTDFGCECRVKTAFLSRDVLFLKVGALNFLASVG